MPTIAKLPSGSWRAHVRRKCWYVSETFLRRDDALCWSRLAELSVDRNETPVSSRIGRLTKFGELIKLHIEDMTAVGNGHPIGVVITTPEIAAAFAKGPEFFSTFGGSTLSCRVGRTVLDIVDDEALMENAQVMGQRLLDGLHNLADDHALIGDVRGMGLFVGVELVGDRERRTPATRQTTYIPDRLREERILIGREGPDNNVLKIRPPLTIDEDGIDMVLDSLATILSETGSAP